MNNTYKKLNQIYNNKHRFHGFWLVVLVRGWIGGREGLQPEMNYCNTDIAQYLKKWMQSGNEIWSVNRIYKHFTWKTKYKSGGETIPRPFLEKSNWALSLDQFSRRFFKKNIFLLYSKDWPNFIVWLSLLREILGKMCIAIAS